MSFPCVKNSVEMFTYISTIILLLYYSFNPVISIGVCEQFCLNRRICFEQYYHCVEYYERLRQSRARLRFKGPNYYASMISDGNTDNCGKQYFKPSIQNYDQNGPLIGRIVGGSPAKTAEFPWIVSLQRPTKRGLEHYCGGSIISDYFILTAAHCADNFVGKEHIIRIRIGATDIGNPDEGYYVKVSQIIVHEGWDRSTNSHDLALYRTDRPIRYKIAEESGQFIVNSICLPLDSYTEPNFGLVAGWGRLGVNDRYMTKLQRAVVPKFPLSDCNVNYRGGVDDSMLCYGGGGDKDSCDGDSGGPLMERRGNQNFIIGLVSFGAPCAIKNFPTVFMKVSKYLDWIHSKILR